MPVILAIDSSADIFSAALGDTTAPPPAYNQQESTAHARIALPLIKSLLARADRTINSCDAFAFSAGPGKFSALRLSCALARTFAYAANKPLLAVPGFTALAHLNYGSAGALTVKCALPAHRQHIYFGICRLQHGKWQLIKTAVHNCDTGNIPAPRVHHACGIGYNRYPQLLGSTDSYNQKAPLPNANAVWQLAAAMLADNTLSDPLTCQPLYLRDKIAKTIHQRNADAS